MKCQAPSVQSPSMKVVPVKACRSAACFVRFPFMRHLSRITITALLAVLFPITASLTQAQAQAAAGVALSADEKKKLLEQATVAQNAVNEWDFEGMMKHVPPLLLRMVGEENFRRQAKASIEESKADGIRFLETTHGEPTPVHVSGEHEVCFVPRTSIVQMKDGRVKSTAFWVAVREKGAAEWKFLDGAPVHANPKALWGLFPDLPKDITIPEWEQEPVK
ncbi:MAG TPA: hypothetical protein PLB55_15270 [Prosthecobacter sp.]|nr:hypothetical protein [Prosthecobacter sp.]